MSKVYRMYGRGLGDCWSHLSYLISLAVSTGKVLKVSKWYWKGDKKRDVGKKLEEMLPLFEYSHMIELVEQDPTEEKIPAAVASSYPLVRSIHHWRPWHRSSPRTIVFQFDGKTHKGKNFSDPADEQRMLSIMIDNGYVPIRLGGHLPLKTCIKYASRASMFVGVESGMGHLCGSVGLPLVYIQNSMPRDHWKRIHSNKHYTLLGGVNEFRDFLFNFSGDPSEYVENCENPQYFCYLNQYLKGLLPC